MDEGDKTASQHFLPRSNSTIAPNARVRNSSRLHLVDVEATGEP
jgi:hypothetical protein